MEGSSGEDRKLREERVGGRREKIKMKGMEKKGMKRSNPLTTKEREGRRDEKAGRTGHEPQTKQRRFVKWDCWARGVAQCSDRVLRHFSEQGEEEEEVTGWKTGGYRRSE